MINIFHTLRSSKITKHQARLPGFQASARPQVHQVHQVHQGRQGRQEPGRDFLGGQLQTLEVDGLKASCLASCLNMFQLKFKLFPSKDEEIREIHWKYGIIMNHSGNKLHQTSKLSEHAIGLQGALLPAVRHSGLSGRV